MSDEIKWSKYQKKIFEFVEKGTGSAVINAVAGSGKTTVIVESANRVGDDKKILFLAFNKSIVGELTSRFSSSNIQCKTLHSYGLWALKRSKQITDTTKIDDMKWRKFFTTKLPALSGNKFTTYTKGYRTIVANTHLLFDMCRINCVRGGNIPEIYAVAKRYGINVEDGIHEIVSNVLEIAYIIKPGYAIDYIDMITLPVMNDAVKKFCVQYDFVFIDEAQDLSLAQQELMKLAIKPGGRFVAVGDPAQAINGFAGALSDSFDRLKDLAGNELPLSVNYRCPKSVITLAQKYVPAITAHRGAIKGEVFETKDLDDIAAGDMVICRTSAPLVSLAMSMVTSGVRAYIKGKDIGETLVKMLTPAAENGDNWSTFIENAIKERESIMKKIDKGTLTETALARFEEKVECCKALHEHTEKPSKMIEFVKLLFDDNGSDDAIKLSTIHKAKGLEADNVYILCANTTRSWTTALQDWEEQQEKNLEYVAVTRAKKKLYKVDVDPKEVAFLRGFKKEKDQ